MYQSQRRLRGQRSKRACRKFAYHAKISMPTLQLLYLVWVGPCTCTIFAADSKSACNTHSFFVFQSVLSDISFITISVAIQELLLVKNRLQIRIQRLNLP